MARVTTAAVVPMMAEVAPMMATLNTINSRTSLFSRSFRSSLVAMWRSSESTRSSMRVTRVSSACVSAMVSGIVARATLPGKECGSERVPREWSPQYSRSPIRGAILARAEIGARNVYSHSMDWRSTAVFWRPPLSVIKIDPLHEGLSQCGIYSHDIHMDKVQICHSVR